MRRSVLVVAAAFALAFSGAAGASVLGAAPSTTPEPGEHPEATEVLEDTDPAPSAGRSSGSTRAGPVT